MNCTTPWYNTLGKILGICTEQYKFLSKIQNLTSEKTRKKILLLSCKKLVKTQFLGVVVFPSIFWFQNIKVVVFPSNFLFQNFKVVVFPSNFWKTTIIWQFFRVILNFAQECYYLKNKVGVVDFTKARGLVKFQSPRAPHSIFEVMYHSMLKVDLAVWHFWQHFFYSWTIYKWPEK